MQACEIFAFSCLARSWMMVRLEALRASRQDAAAYPIRGGGLSGSLARLADNPVATLPNATGAVASLTSMLDRCGQSIVVDRKPFSESHLIISFSNDC